MSDGFAYMFGVGFAMLCLSMFFMWVGNQTYKPGEWPTPFLVTVMALLAFGGIGVGVVLLFAVFGGVR